MSVLQKQLVRHSTAVKAGGVIAMGVFMLLVIAWPMVGKLRETMTKLKVREKESEEIAKRVAVLSGLDKEILKSRVGVLDKALPNKKDVLLYLSTIDSLSGELGLSFNGISLAPGNVSEASSSGTGRNVKAVPDEVPGVHSLETDVRISGEKENLFAFLRAIEQSLPLMQVKDAKVVVVGDNQYSLSLRLGMLWASGDLSNVKGAITLFNEKEEAYFQQLAGYKVYSVVGEGEPVKNELKENIFAPTPLTVNEIQFQTQEASLAGEIAQ